MVEVLTGADQLASFEEKFLAGKRVGLLTNPTGINRHFQSTVSVCANLKSAKLAALFACEHGIRGERQAGVLFEDEFDSELQVPVFSLYGEHKKPTAAMMDAIDVLVFDIQDLGIRFYTYLSTLIYAMEACAKHGKHLVVLDRPNPLGGLNFEGGMLESGFESIVGAWQIPIRSGLTIGEMAQYINSQMNPSCDLSVVPLQNWTRDMEYTATGLPWMLPSPNMPTMETVRVYAGTCYFEGTNLSEGRGTTLPFEMIGAPWLKASKLADTMNALALPGVHFHALYFTPTFSKHQGDLCHGVRLFVTDPVKFKAVETGLHLLHHVITMHEQEFEWLTPFSEESKPFIDLLTGSEQVRLSIHTQEGLTQIIASWNDQLEQWEKARQPYLIYGVSENGHK
ncbi:exo-beta-N-acetylmuramidase NamZ family protein [Paenibacillus sp. KN14-4R]|uniref:exo-beta-N-acetylmuramidase NamZ family protein n=1 Tax=Paenibacillus sp. KN14-4R TaxID=3445773 RepID=UPI003F9F14CF